MKETTEAVTTEVIKNKSKRTLIESGLARLAELKMVMDSAKIESDKIKAEMVSAFASNNISKVLYADSVFSIHNGTNVSINADLLRASMLAHRIKADLVGVIIKEGTKQTPYTTLMVKKRE